MKKSATTFSFVWRRAERLGANECAGANKLRQTQRCACKVVEPMQCAKGGVGQGGEGSGWQEKRKRQLAASEERGCLCEGRDRVLQAELPR
jgi:hypothetical protein